MPTSPRPYRSQEKKFNKGDMFRDKKDMVLAKDINEDRKDRLIRWNTFFRRNPMAFIQMYFGVKLFPYQIIMLWMLQRSILAYFVMARAAAKSWIIALWSMTIATLYPGSEVIVCAKTIKQGSIILEKLSALREGYTNIAREIKQIVTNSNSNVCYLHNGSTIKVVPSSESARGK